MSASSLAPLALRAKASRCASRASPRSRTSPSTCGPANCSRSSAPTARARPRSSTCSRASTSQWLGSVTLRGARSPAAANRPDRAGGHRAHLPEPGPVPAHTVLDYLLLGRHSRMRSGVMLGGLYLGPTRDGGARNRAYCLRLLALLGLDRFRDRPLGSLPFGLQKRADLARALAAQPDCCCWMSQWQA